VGRRRIESGFRIDFQAKSTTLAHLDPDSLRYDLEVTAYESLRYADAGCPRYLVVLVLPFDEKLWLEQSEEALVLRQAAYWLSLRGASPRKNRRSIRVELPRANLLTPRSLQEMMNRIKTGGIL
jgi:hypothetical protein